MEPQAERPGFPGLLLIRTRCPDTFTKENLWMKAQHEGALTPPFIIQKNPQVTNTVQQVVCHPMNNSRGKWSSIPPHKARPDFLYQLCRETAIRVSTGARKPRRGNMRFLPPLEMRLSSIAPNPVESREAPPNSTVPLTSQRHPEKLHEVTGTCRGNPGFPATMRKRTRESYFNVS